MFPKVVGAFEAKAPVFPACASASPRSSPRPGSAACPTTQPHHRASMIAAMPHLSATPWGPRFGCKSNRRRLLVTLPASVQLTNLVTWRFFPWWRAWTSGRNSFHGQAPRISPPAAVPPRFRPYLPATSSTSTAACSASPRGPTSSTRPTSTMMFPGHRRGRRGRDYRVSTTCFSISVT